MYETHESDNYARIYRPLWFHTDTVTFEYAMVISLYSNHTQHQIECLLVNSIQLLRFE